MPQTSKVAIIGLGNIGAAVATNLSKSKRAIIVADRNIEKAKALTNQLGSAVQALDIPTAIKEADIIVLAIWFDAIKEFVKTYAAELAGKVIVDPSNPIAPDEKGGFKKTIEQNQSAGEIISSLIPKGAKLAKALGTLSVASLQSAAYQKPAAVLFYATDDTSINNEIEQLIRDNGFEPIRAGGINQSIRLEVFGDLHEFGALGKTVTVEETTSKL